MMYSLFKNIKAFLIVTIFVCSGLFIVSSLYAQGNCDPYDSRKHIAVRFFDEFGNRWGMTDGNPANDCGIPSSRMGVNIIRPGVPGNWVDTHGNWKTWRCGGEPEYNGGGFDIRSFRCNNFPAGAEMIFELQVPAPYDANNLTWDYYDIFGNYVMTGSGRTVRVPPPFDPGDPGESDGAFMDVHMAPPCPASISTAPTNLDFTCGFSGTNATVSWTPDPNASFYAIRLDNTSIPNGNPCSSGQSGDLCNEYVTGNSINIPINPPTGTFTFWMHSRCGNVWGPAVQTTIQCTGDCTVSAPSTALVGSPVTITSTHTSLDGDLTGAVERNNFIRIGSRFFGASATSGTLTSTWTPTAADVGTHTLWCRSWNDGRTECRPPSYVDGPPRYACRSPLASRTITVAPPEPWYKLKDTSFHKQSALSMMITNPVNKYTNTDLDDNTDPYMLIGEAGLVSAQGTITITSSSGKVANNDWKVSNSYTPSRTYLQDLDTFTAYLQQNKSVNSGITSLSQIRNNEINIMNPPGGNLNIANNASNRLPAGNYVLIVNGSVTFTTPTYPAGNVNNGGSIAIIATGNLRVHSNYSEINAILIGQGVDLGYDVPAGSPSTNPLKINGNLIAGSGIITKRKRTDYSRPSLFIVFKSKTYLDLLPLLSTIEKKGSQLQ